MVRSGWTELRAATDPAHFGHKAATLARILGGGLPVLPGWVLAVGTGPQELPELARALPGLNVASRWILRSSSPMEDRPGRSAAGWFRTEISGASGPELERALRRVYDAASAPELVTQLGAAPPLAILAQPHLNFGTWCTVEVRDAGCFYEGWRRSAGRVESWSATGHAAFDGLVAEVLRTGAIDPALLELGLHEDRAFVLQLRPAPARAPQSVPPAEPRVVHHAGLGPRVHDGDGQFRLVADVEHCPAPLCVLLATTFGRWIQEDATHTTSRIVDGRWHDREERPAALITHEQAATEVQAHERACSGPLSLALGAVRGRADQLDGSIRSWRAFLSAWLDLQRLYFSMPGRSARAWAQHSLADAGGAPDLESTPAAGRRRAWAALQSDIFATQDPPERSAESIARWVAAHPTDPVVQRVHETAQAHRAVAPLPYDGCTPGLDEDPWPLYRALAGDLSARQNPQAIDLDPEQELARHILRTAESDNELLLEAYAAWRAGLVRVARARRLTSARELHSLDIGSFEAWLDGGRWPDAAAAAGRALHSAWSSVDSRDADGVGSLIAGRAAAGGIARGPVNPGQSLLELEAGGIAVVDTLGPADAIAVPRFDAVVCAGGDVLGHASVLCREFAIPCVVGIEGVRSRLRGAGEILVDGDAGTVRVLR